MNNKSHPLVDGKKRCPKCGEYKELSEFHKDKSKPYGVVAHCKSCVKAKHAKYYIENKEKVRAVNKEWRTNNPDKAHEISHRNYINNKEKSREHSRQWQKDNPDKVKAASAKWRANNKQKQIQATVNWKKNNPDKLRIAKQRQYQRYKQDLQFVLSGRIANGIRHSLKNIGSKANRKWDTLVDFTPIELKKHLESQFDEKMSWDNYGSYWHIDHIIPIAAFNFETPEDIDFKRCWNLNNLQPLEKTTNMRKNDRVDIPFQPSLAIAV